VIHSGTAFGATRAQSSLANMPVATTLQMDSLVWYYEHHRTGDKEVDFSTAADHNDITC
jgi:hypothetical protein